MNALKVQRTRISSKISEAVAGIFACSLGSLALIALVSVGFILWGYGETCHYDFVFDDWNGVVNNPAVTEFFAGKGMNFTRLIEFSGERVLGFLSFVFSWERYGPDPCGFRQLNILIHMISAFFCGLITLSLLANVETASSQKFRLLAAVVATGLFAAHPIQTQAVTYIYQRLAGMAGMFTLLSFWAALRWFASGRRLFLWGAVLCFSCALYTKPNTALLPVMILFAGFLFGTFRWRKMWVFLVAYCGIPVLMIRSAGSLSHRVEMHGSEGLGSLDYWLVQGRVIWHYLYLVFWPKNLSAGHVVAVTQPSFGVDFFLSVGGWLAIAAIFLISAYLSLSQWKNRSLSLVHIGVIGILWFFVMILIESSVIPIRDLMMEHRVYLPFAGLVWLIAIFVAQVITKLPSGRHQTMAVSVVLVGILGLASLTESRNRVWANSQTLWSSVLETDPNNQRALLNLGNAMVRKGSFGQAMELYDRLLKNGGLRADALYQKALVRVFKGELGDAERTRQTLIAEFSGEQLRSEYLRGLILLQSAKPRDALKVFERWEQLLRAEEERMSDPSQRSWIRTMQIRQVQATEKINSVPSPKKELLLERMLAERPEDLEVRIWLARHLAKLNRIPEALWLLNDGGAHASSDQKLWLSLVSAEIIEDPANSEIASARYREILRKYPASADSRLWFGGWLGILTDNDQIHQSIGGVRELDAIADYAIDQAMKMSGIGRFDESVRYLTRAKSLCESTAKKCTKKNQISELLNNFRLQANPDEKF